MELLKWSWKKYLIYLVINENDSTTYVTAKYQSPLYVKDRIVTKKQGSKQLWIG